MKLTHILVAAVIAGGVFWIMKGYAGKAVSGNSTQYGKAGDDNITGNTAGGFIRV